MADHQRIHPVVQDVEAPQPPVASAPETPLVQRGGSKSERGNPPEAPPRPSDQDTIPMMHSKSAKKKRSCLCRCLCWTISLILLQLIIIAIIVGIIFLIFRPKLPKYSIDTLQVTDFNLNNDQSLNATFDVTITARNPNKKIGIYYEGGSRVRVYYSGTQLCQGALPKFYQGHRNTTELILPLTGQTQNATELLSRLQTQQQQLGYVPLNVRVRQPVRIKLGKLKLMKVKFVVRCTLQVDSLSANNQISIKNSRCKYRFRL